VGGAADGAGADAADDGAAGDGGALAAEAALLQRAQTALAAGDPEGALRSLGEHARGFTLDASATVTPIEWLHISLMGYNLIDLDSALTPVQVGGSVGVLLPDFGLGIGTDLLVDLSTFSSAQVIAGFGVEYTAAELVPIRLGYRRDRGRETHTLSLGVGYIADKFGVDFSMRHDVRALPGNRLTELLVTFRYNVQ